MVSVPEIRESLLGNTDWSVLDAAVWLAAEGRHYVSIDTLVPAFCDHLVTLGAPLWRARIGARTLHPQVRARSCEWVRGEPPTTTDVPHAMMEGPDYVGSPIEHIYRTKVPLRCRLDQLDPRRDHATLLELSARGGRDYLAVPLRFADGEFGSVFIVATDRPGGFSATDVAGFLALGEFIAPLLESLSGTHVARSLLDTYLGPRTGKRVLEGRITRGDGERINAAMWFSDLRESTSLSEQLSLAELLDALNQYFELVAAAVSSRGGEILRFIGDAMLVVFTEADRSQSYHACEAALNAADDALSALETLNHRRRRRGEPALSFGLGLHFGDVIYGNVGAPARLDFTVMGAAVNRTARLESLTKSLGQPILMSPEFARHVSRPVCSLGKHPMKGFSEPQEVMGLG